MARGPVPLPPDQAVGYSMSQNFDQWAFELGYTNDPKPGFGSGYGYAGILLSGVVTGVVTSD